MEFHMILRRTALTEMGSLEVSDMLTKAHDQQHLQHTAKECMDCPFLNWGAF